MLRRLIFSRSSVVERKRVCDKVRCDESAGRWMMVALRRDDDVAADAHDDDSEEPTAPSRGLRRRSIDVAMVCLVCLLAAAAGCTFGPSRRRRTK